MQSHHRHHVGPLARISLTLSRHFSLSFIASQRSSWLHPVSSHSCCMYVLAARPAFTRPCVGVHRSTSLMSSSLILQQCPACLFRLTWIVFVMGGRWPYSWCYIAKVINKRRILFSYAVSSSSSCRAASTDIPDPLSPLLPIVHRLRQVFRTTSRILTQLLYVCSSWSSCFCSAICGVHRSKSLMSSSFLLQQ